MKTIMIMSFILALGAMAFPAFAQSNGTGGSGAGQPSAGSSKSQPGAPTADNTIRKPAGTTTMMSTVGENPKAGQIKGGGDPMLLKNGSGTAQAPAISTGGPNDANPSGQ